MKRIRNKRIEGYTALGFESVKALFEHEMNNKAEKEAQLCVYHRGKIVVDLWACSPNNTDFSADSIVPVFSSGKTLEALGLAHLVDLSLLNYDQKISDYWPEFGSNGKEEITIADLMRHEAGLVEFKYTFKHDELFTENIKQNSVGSVIENAKRRISNNHLLHRQYHAATRGWVANELFRRVEPNGRTLGEYIRDDIALPLGIDVNIGLDPDKQDRTAKVRAISIAFHILESFKPKFIGRKVMHDAQQLYNILASLRKISLRELRHAKQRKQQQLQTEAPEYSANPSIRKKPWAPLLFGLNGPFKGLYPFKYREKAMNVFNLPDVLKGESPSMNATCTARGLAKLGAAMAAGGTFEGKTYFGKESWQALHDKKKSLKMDGAATTFFTQGGLSFFTSEGLENTTIDKGMHQGREGFYGWMGAGGSIFQWNPDLDIGFAFVPTSLHLIDLFNERGKVYQSEILKCINRLEQNNII